MILSSFVGSLYNSGFTVKGMHGVKSLSANISCRMQFEDCGVRGCGRRLDQSEYRAMAEVSFPVLVSPANAREK